jgi:prolyl oligopeptidase
MQRSVALPSSLGRMGRAFLLNGWVHELKRGTDNPSGVWQRTKLERFGQKDAPAELLLDLREIPAHEGVACSWSWFGAHDPVTSDCNPQRCLMRFNVAGGDRVILREFDLEQRRFVDDGFNVDVPSSIEVEWFDADTVMILAELNPDERTLGGWPRIIRRWSRGTRIEDAPIAFDPGTCTHVTLAPGRVDGHPIQLVHVMRTYQDNELWLLEQGREPRRLPLPARLGFSGTAGVACGQLIFHTDADAEVSGVQLPAGTLASFDLSAWMRGAADVRVHRIFSTQDGHVFNKVFGLMTATAGCTPAALWYVTIDKVRPALWRATVGTDGWTSQSVSLPEWHNVAFTRTDGNRLLAHVEGFVDPPCVMLIDESAALRPLRTAPAALELSRYRTQQRWATSADGTQVPYFVVSQEQQGPSVPGPTMLYAYGGFGVTLTPQYFGPFMGCDAQLHWLAEGGTCVFANIRGGGELGPQWAAAATGPNRQRAFDDFYAVAQALIEEQVTTRDQLAAAGLSNGGLLTSVALTQRPELFRAVISGVPLTDMARYHQLLAGMSWVSEYGNPDDPEQREWVMRYSPLHHIKPARPYPEPLYYSNTSDDRVHPGHARRMVAKLRAMGHAALYFEGATGGHAGSMDPESSAVMSAVQATYLMQKTGLAAPASY